MLLTAMKDEKKEPMKEPQAQQETVVKYLEATGIPKAHGLSAEAAYQVAREVAVAIKVLSMSRKVNA